MHKMVKTKRTVTIYIMNEHKEVAKCKAKQHKSDTLDVYVYSLGRPTC